MKSLPGWTTKIDEISNGVFKVTLTDSYGRIAEIVDDASDKTIDKALNDAFEIEKQVSKNWNKFLYDFCISNLADTTITNKDFNDNAFGSWLIQVADNRIVYMGKDAWLVAQLKQGDNWFDTGIFRKEDLTYLVISTLIKVLK